MYSIQPGPHSVPAGCFLPAGDRAVSLTAGFVPGTVQANRRGLVRAPHASDEAVPVPSASEERRTSIHCLRQCIRALCEAAAWIADLSPLQAACIASLRTRSTPLAPLCGYSHNAAASLPPCWSCEAWSRTDRCVRLDAKRPVRGLGEPQQAASEYRKRYSDALLAHSIASSLNRLSVCAIICQAMTRQIGIYGDIIMEKKLQGIALILFGIMLLLISMHSPWIPIIGTDYTDLALWIGIILGIVGFVFVFRKER